MDNNTFNSSKNEAIDFSDLVQALLDNSQPLAARYLYRLSGLEGEELKQFTSIWPKVELSRRRALIEDLEELAEANTLVTFESVSETALDDPDPIVRRAAIRSLWESVRLSLVDKFIQMLDNDYDSSVRAQAAAGLGNYVFMGEMEEIKKETLDRVVDKLLGILDDKQIDPNIRSQALTALGFSSHSRVAVLIEDSFETGDEDWQRCALITMERSADKQWTPYVMNSLDHESQKVRLAAINAAGELEILDAIPMLIEALQQDDEEEIRMGAAWALSQIGGDEAREAIESYLEQTEDEDEIDLLEDALENLDFYDDMINFDMFDFDEEDLDDLSAFSPDDED
jgi:HEAT repeat protein